MTVLLPENDASTPVGKQQGAYSNGYNTRSRANGTSSKASSNGESATNGGLENGYARNGIAARHGAANGLTNGHANGLTNGHASGLTNGHRGENGHMQQPQQHGVPQQNVKASSHRPINGSQMDAKPQTAAKAAPKSDDWPGACLPGCMLAKWFAQKPACLSTRQTLVDGATLFALARS